MEGDAIAVPPLEQLSAETIRTLGVIVASHARAMREPDLFDEPALRALHAYLQDDAIWAAVKRAAGLK